MENSDQLRKNINILQLITIALFGSILSKGQALFWEQHSDQYLLSIDDES